MKSRNQSFVGEVAGLAIGDLIGVIVDQQNEASTSLSNWRVTGVERGSNDVVRRVTAENYLPLVDEPGLMFTALTDWDEDIPLSRVKEHT